VAEARPRAEDFLELVERSKRGRLKVYIGFAAGVGKTYRMLEEAHALKKRGVDVVVGFVETHGRAETAALVSGLEVVPQRRIEYRGVSVEEMDVDAVIARHPQVALIDEIAHTNAPGSRHPKRYRDVLEVLDAGINVICAFNVQHLESLKDIVERATAVTIRETVPDTFLAQADQVVNLDLAVEDLVDRLRAGKIYREEKIAHALENFFRDENLATLRELALREVAASVDRAATAQAQRQDATRRDPASDRILVCLASNSPYATQLLRRGSRMAGRLNTDWYVAYVETPQEAPMLIDSTAQRHLAANIDKARELGAEFVRLHGTDPVATLLEFARSHGVNHIVIGRTAQPTWKRLLGRSFMDRMVTEATDLDLHIVAVDGDKGPLP
jgi:two-component system, OmpR family, sensor histidine kinase KdpD